MTQKLVCYSLRKLTAVQRMKFQREMYGFKDISNYGKYAYRRPGIMDSIKHRKIYYSSLRVSEKDLEKVLTILKKHKAEIHVSGLKCH
ncbi:MAG: hypothetical protein HY514_00605 [Candidatus Aenigmarchaeota archaeon]|nr:hypothetical protein [Candidatus Aenigmarchaeota archaeon]